MKYLIFQDKQTALDRSKEIAISLGCVGSITTYWFGVIEHPTTFEGAMEISENEEDKLTSSEILELKDKNYLETNGWFPNNTSLG